MTSPELSICIPAYEMGGRGVEFLTRALISLAAQDFNNFEVVVSDQSEDDGIRKLCAQWQPKLRIIYVSNQSGLRQASGNTNCALNAASGRILKVLFQDDFLLASDALRQMHDAFEASDRKWLICGSGISRDGVTLEKTMKPRMSSRVLFGRNTVSSPSVLALRSECTERFDEKLIWLMDVEFYKRLEDTYGPAIVLPDALVANGIHDTQVSSSIKPELVLSELEYVYDRHRPRVSLAGKFEFLKQKRRALRKMGSHRQKAKV